MHGGTIRRQMDDTYGRDFVTKFLGSTPDEKITRHQAALIRKVHKMKSGGFQPYALDYAYVVHDRQGRCKVGRTALPKSRLISLRGSSPVQLYLAGVVAFGAPGAAAFEKAMHRLLKARGLHLHLEWFAGDHDDILRVMHDLANANYPQVTLMADAWDAFEPFMPLYRHWCKGDTHRLERVEKARAEFLWVVDRMADKCIC